MRRICLIAALLLVPLLCRGQVADTPEGGSVYDSLRSYFEAISVMPVDSICSRLDVLIESAADDDIRAGIAGRAFDYYMDSPVMGSEGVAVYIADNYFLNKRLRWPSEETFPLLYTFAEFNRQSLLGKPAPELVLESLEGGFVDVREATGGYKILYFYEDACSTCVKQTPLLVSLLNEYSGTTPLSFYAVYTQSDKAAWAKYAISNFGGIDNPQVRIYNLWDPEGASEFHKKYSVLSTPSLLLLDADNRITGRKLDAAALAELLGQKESFTASLYELMDGIRDNIGLDSEAIADVCEAFSSRIGDDADMYRNTYLGIYNYLRGQGEYEAMESAAFLAQKYILDQPDMWSAEVEGQIGEAVRLFRQNPVGAIAPDAVLIDSHGREKAMLAAGGRKYTVLFFNLVSCSECAAWKQQLRDMKKLLKRSGARVVSVYVGPEPDEWLESVKTARRGSSETGSGSICSCWWRDLRTSWPDSSLYQDYDVTTAPRLYLLDSSGTILAKDITPDTLREILEQ